MKVQLVRLGIMSGLALVLMASRCSGDGETGKLETTGDIPEEVDPAAVDASSNQEPTDPLGDPFSTVPDSEDPSMEPDPMIDDGATFDDPSFEPDAVPEDAEL